MSAVEGEAVMPSLSKRTLRLVELVLDGFVDGDKPNGMGRREGAGDCSLVPTGTTGVVMLVNELFFSMPSRTLLLDALLLALATPFAAFDLFRLILLLLLLLLLKLARFLLDTFESGLFGCCLNSEARSLWGVCPFLFGSCCGGGLLGVVAFGLFRDKI